jgi:hypothetical protein
MCFIGDDGKAESENPGLLKDSENLYTLWCSGRTCCEGMLVELKFLKVSIYVHNKLHIVKMQRLQSKILWMITNAPRYVTNQTLHDDLKVPFIKDVIQERSINHHDKLGNHSDPILQPLLEQQQRRRLKKLWPVDLIDG